MKRSTRCDMCFRRIASRSRPMRVRAERAIWTVCPACVYAVVRNRVIEMFDEPVPVTVSDEGRRKARSETP